MIYVIADTHFSHNNIIKYCNRPFENTSLMNQYMVEKWNNIVKPNDIVFHLGDVGFGLKEQLIPLITNLKGHKILLRGNHDYSRGNIYWGDLGFELVYKRGIITLRQFLEDVSNLYQEDISSFKKYLDKVVFTHQPIECSNDILNIHGHIHNAPLDNIYNIENHYCVSVEMVDYTPQTLQNILDKKL